MCVSFLLCLSVEFLALYRSDAGLLTVDALSPFINTYYNVSANKYISWLRVNRVHSNDLFAPSTDCTQQKQQTVGVRCDEPMSFFLKPKSAYKFSSQSQSCFSGGGTATIEI